MFTTKIKVYFYDADPAGIIFYANIFRFAHVAFEDFIRSQITHRDYFFDREYSLPVIHTEADYTRPIKVGDELHGEVFISQLRNSSFEVYCRFYQDNMFAASTKTVHVCVSKESFEKIALPEELSRMLNANLIL
jgi:acyl-CoA thioester hydrolase/1,4-dihydroxy-2-naphthoyl-CoA hydrolase